MRHRYKTTSRQQLVTQRGFTIVELLIVIVIIGILATITVVAYSGIQASAGAVVLKSDLNQAQTQLELDRINNSTYPATESGLPGSDGTNYEYTKTGNEYCITASSDRAKTSFHLDSTSGAIADGPCSGHTGYSGGEVAFDQPNDCPTGFIPVPGNSLFATEGGFCVMKYEAKQVGSSTTPISTASGTPWVSISQTTAIANSPNVTGCTSCHLITEPEWLTIAHNVLNVDSNWSGGSVGSGYIYSGHNDNSPNNTLAASSDDSDGYSGTGNSAPSNQRRTLALSNGEVIWDLAGNVWNWTAGTSTTGQPGSSGYAWREWNALTTSGSLSPNPMPSFGTPAASGWTSDQGIGQIYSNSDETALRGFLRSGAWGSGGVSGVLALASDKTPSFTNGNIGFRVAR